jgi:hypothetical protein
MRPAPAWEGTAFYVSKISPRDKMRFNLSEAMTNL